MMKKNATLVHANFKGALFDLDGVIVDSMPYHAEAWIKVLRERDIIVNEIDIYKREGMTGIASVRDIFLERNVPAPDDRELEVMIQWKNTYFETYTVEVFSDAIELLYYFKSIGKLLGLVTGSSKRAVQYMLSESIIKLFDVIITADDITAGKPDPEPYNKAVEKIDLNKSELIVVENAPMGILSAKSAGLYCVALETTLTKDYLHNADLIFDNHRNMLNYFKQKSNLQSA